MNNIFYTIGHATRSLNEFIDLLKSQNITLLADIRSVPRSRHNPEFNKDNLPNELKLHGINYLHIPELGGFKAKSKTIPFELNAFWEHNSFHSYADYAMGDVFQNALKKLLDLNSSECICLMCAEMLWWRCHRRIVSDYLLINDKKVFHIISKNSIKPAQLTLNARVNSKEIINYPNKY